MNATLSADELTRLARGLESLRPAGAPPAWAEVLGSLGDSREVRWHPDLTTLVGFVAPPLCQALASVGYGTARYLGDDTPPEPAIVGPGEGRRVRAVCLMTRCGALAGYLRDGPVVLIDEPPSVGRVLDCMRRAFGLPTPPPEEPTDVLLARFWLIAVADQGRAAGRRLTWREVALLHPVVGVATAAGLLVPPSQFERILRLGAEVWDWNYLLSEASEPGWIADVLPKGAAGWVDEGMLSRFMSDAIPSADVLLATALAVVEPAAGKRIRSVLARLGLGGR